jgi:hypothetical protein
MYNNNLEIIFTHVVMLEKEKTRLVTRQKRASDEVASLSMCVLTITSGHIFLMFNMYVDSCTSFLNMCTQVRQLNGMLYALSRVL